MMKVRGEAGEVAYITSRTSEYVYELSIVPNRLELLVLVIRLGCLGTRHVAQ